MNRALRRQRERQDAHAAFDDYKRQIAALTDEKGELLDMLNALLIEHDGVVRIPVKTVQDARRHVVDVTVIPPEPDTAGSEAMYEFRLRGYEPPAETEKDVKERLKERGLWLPGEET